MANQPTHDEEGEAILNTIRDNIQAERARLRLTTPELAARSGVNKSQLYKFLSGRTNGIGTDAAIRVARVLHMSVAELAGTGPERTLMEEEVAEACRLYSHLPTKNRRLVRDYMGALIAEEREEVVRAAMLFAEVPPELRALVLAQIEAVLDQAKTLQPRRASARTPRERFAENC